MLSLSFLLSSLLSQRDRAIDPCSMAATCQNILPKRAPSNWLCHKHGFRSVMDRTTAQKKTNACSSWSTNFGRVDCNFSIKFREITDLSFTSFNQFTVNAFIALYQGRIPFSRNPASCYFSSLLFACMCVCVFGDENENSIQNMTYEMTKSIK